MAGAPGASYTLALLALLREQGVESHLVMCGCSRAMTMSETGLGLRQIRSKADGWYHERNQAAAISSGSFLTMGMVIVPCTMRSLGAVVAGVADNLVQRAADVTLKEGRPLMVVLVEETYSLIGAQNISRAQEAGVRVLTAEPPVPGSGQAGSLTARVLDEVSGCFGLAMPPLERAGARLR